MSENKLQAKRKPRKFRLLYALGLTFALALIIAIGIAMTAGIVWAMQVGFAMLGFYPPAGLLAVFAVIITLILVFAFLSALEA